MTSVAGWLTADNELSHTTTLTYDNMNDVLSSEDELGDKTTLAYDAKGKRTSVVDANRKVLGTAESGSACGSAGTGNGVDDDVDGRIDDGCPSMIYNYNDLDQLTSVVDAAGRPRATRMTLEAIAPA